MKRRSHHVPEIIGKSGPGQSGLMLWGLAGVALLALPGCITLKAPDKPIEINLNVKVQQEVIVRLQKDAQDLIEQNPELFPS